jgi:hypothetical protein
MQDDVLNERDLKIDWFDITMERAATPYTSFEPMVLELHYSREGIPLPETAVVRRVIPNPPLLLISESPCPATHTAADKELEVA